MRRVVLIVGAVVFVDAMFYAALAPVLPAYADRLQLSETGAGLLAASYGLGTLFGALPAAALAARTSAKTAVVAGLTVLALASVGFAAANTVVLLDVARVLQGVGGSCAWLGALAWLVEVGPRERRGELLGSALAVAIAGAVVGPALGAVADIVGSGAAFGAAGLGAGLLAVVACYAPSHGAGRRRHARPRRRWRTARIWTGIWLIALAALFAGLLGVLMPLRLAALGAGAVAIGAIFLVSAAGEAAMSSIGGRLADRRGSAFPLAIALALAAAVTAVLPWPGDAWMLALLVVVASGVFGLVWAPAMALLSDQAEANSLDPSLAFAFAGIAFALGQVVGAAAGGSLAQAVGQVIPYSVIAVLCLATLGLFRSAGSSARPRLPAG